MKRKKKVVVDSLPRVGRGYSEVVSRESRKGRVREGAGEGGGRQRERLLQDLNIDYFYS